MAPQVRVSRCIVTPAGLGGVLLVAAFFGATAPAEAQYAVPPVTEGVSYYMTAHGFSAFIGPDPDTGEPGPLDLLAEEARLEGHTSLGVQAIEGSTPTEHWSRGDGDDSQNPAKVALRAGGVDVFVMSPGESVPDGGIDRFGDLVIETNPEGRILVQHSWTPWDGRGESAGGDFSNDDRNLADIETIQSWIDDAHSELGSLGRVRSQLVGINQRAGRAMAFAVPAADAVYRLRQEVLRGRIPGIDRQSELFRDGMGHPTPPVVNLVTYVWFTVLYRQPASGLTALVDSNDAASAERERLLQQIAWEVAAAEPMSGITSPLLWPRGVRDMHELMHQLGTTDEGMQHSDH